MDFKATSERGGQGLPRARVRWPSKQRDAGVERDERCLAGISDRLETQARQSYHQDGIVGGAWTGGED
jgi:hypothetical protein